MALDGRDGPERGENGRRRPARRVPPGGRRDVRPLSPPRVRPGGVSRRATRPRFRAPGQGGCATRGDLASPPATRSMAAPAAGRCSPGSSPASASAPRRFRGIRRLVIDLVPGRQTSTARARNGRLTYSAPNWKGSMPMTSDPARSRPADALPRPMQSPARRAVRVLFGRDAVASGGAPGGGAAAAAAGGTEDPGALVRLRLVLLSFLMLFVELALIRWLGANIVYLSYYSNFVLLGSFLGIGIGLLRARSRLNLFPLAPVALALLVLFVLRFPVQISHTSGTQLIFFGTMTTTGLPTWLMLPVIFLAVAAVMAMIGEGVARTFVRFKPLEAYRLDILRRIVGIATFSSLPFFHAKPLPRGIITAFPFLSAHGRRIVPIPFSP